VHVLWVNTVSAAVLGLVLAFEIREKNIMRRPPRAPDAPILTPVLMWRILIVAGFILGGAFGLYELALAQGASIASARTLAVNAVIVIEIFYLLNCRSLVESSWRVGLGSNRWVLISIAAMLGLQMLFTYAVPVNRVLSTAPITLAHWGWIVLVGLASYIAVELEKGLRRRRAA